MMSDSHDQRLMAQALELALQGRGAVEPNPMVGGVIVRDGEIIAAGWHQEFGGPHAEIVALTAASGKARGGDLYVTLEPCCHHGKTPPCTDALIAAGMARVVIGCQDPNPIVAGQGIACLRDAGLAVEVLDCTAARKLIAPFTKLVTQKQPWVIAKWAMTLDGKIASHTGESQWISSPTSRALVHQLRGQMDAILVGRQTVERDNPLLTARPAGPRVATRIVLDSEASISPDSQLVRSVEQAPLMIVARESASKARISQLEDYGAEVFKLPLVPWQEQLQILLAELGSRRMTNLMVEGGALVLGAFADIQAIDEVHAFIAPKLVGGKEAPSPMAGQGVADMAGAQHLADVEINVLEGDVHVHGFVERT
jgi:diaminohydroxyphosphoribosylaminopyrimidine deaminase/5-amino-6-(5-phosphoribosylamino)uracil reductase